jgi:hypothetical protein
VRLTELDPMTREAISVYCRCKAAQSVLDPAIGAEVYLRAQNATQRAYLNLERRLRAVGLDQANGGDPAAALRRHVAENYTDGHRSSGVAAPSVDAAAGNGSYEHDATASGVEGLPAAAGASS